MTALLFLLSLFSLATSSIHGLSIDFDIVHRDSPLSPFYNSSSTLSELARKARLRSLSRSARRQLLRTDVLPPIIVQDEGEYLMRIYVGSPPLETWAIADTGSDLIWVQCLPCDTCYPQDSPIFNPLESSTYQMVSCLSKPCTFFPKKFSGCAINSTQCAYVYGYGDNSTTFGDLGRDLFSFGGDDNGSFLVFGCGHNNTGIFSSKGSGLVGLGAGPLSLVSQLGSEIGYKFSYCLVPYFSNFTGKLKLGQEANISASNGAVSTPYTLGGFQKSNYMLTFEGISIGNQTVETGPKREGNTLIDSGATWFSMESSFYSKVEALIKKSIGVEEVKNASGYGFNLCYSNNHAETIMNKFPDFAVHFKGGADVYLKPDHNIFLPQDNAICLAIFPVDEGSGFTYGNVPQVNFQVEYDLQAKKISFAPAECNNY